MTTFNGKVYALGIFRGETIAGGLFTLPATRIAAWNGTTGTWRGLGEGFNGIVHTLAVFNNVLVAGATLCQAAQQGRCCGSRSGTARGGARLAQGLTTPCTL